MKWLIVLLVVLAGGVAAAAFSVPTNAAVVNGTSISQQTLNSDVSAIAGSPSYQCYLNSETYLSSGGSQQLPIVVGVGQGQNAGDHPTANSTFVASYLDTEIGHQIVLQVADARRVTVTPQQLADARTTLTQQISSVMSEILQTAEGQNPALQLHRHGPATDRPGGARHHAVLVRRRGGAIRRHRQRARGGRGRCRLQPVPAWLAGYYVGHHAQFDTG